MKVRIVSPGWETFTGPLGQNAFFEDGVSVGELTLRQVARIGSSLQLIDEATGKQVGPSVIAAGMKFESAPVAEVLQTKAEADAVEAVEKQKLIEAENARKEQEAKDLEAAKAKAAEEAKSIVYTRQELEAVGANDGVAGLRAIADPLGVKGRAISDLVDAILAAQAKNAAA